MITPKNTNSEMRGIPLQMVTPAQTWFKGLNALRFFAAALVVVMHTNINMINSGLPHLPAWPVLFKGETAVSFFFVLSGFLITYLLLQEINSSGTIIVKKFYARRIVRIWPLYFIIVTSGILFYWKLVPLLHLNFTVSYPHWLAVILYSFFLANLMNSLYHVGGMLNITWSIAVEEQFYLFWAPLVKRFNNKIPTVITTITLLSLALNILNRHDAFHLPGSIKAFIDTLQFHYMGIGASFAWLLFNRRTWLLRLPVFTSRFLQLLCTAALLAYLLLNMRTPRVEAISPLLLGLLFSWLILNVSSNSKRIFSLENQVLNFLGKISYGIYMFHMPVVYAIAFFFKKTGLAEKLGFFYFPFFFALVFSLTIALAATSYKYLEQALLKQSKNLY